MNLIKTLIILLFVVSCASRGRQTDRFLKSSYDIPRKHKIADVSFIKQDDNYCGPASLAMMMNHAGTPVSMEELAKQLYTPGKEGTFQTDMITATRTRGLLAVQLKPDISEVLKEVAAGNPVLIFENLGVSWYQLWHYAVVIGYDLKKEKIILHSGKEDYLRTNIRRFEEEWGLGNYWAVVILRPNEISETGNDLAHAAGAAGLEQVGRIAEAKTAYQTMLSKWPDSLSALIGMGNIAYNQQRYADAIEALEQAIKYHPQSAIAWHNLTIAYDALGLDKKAKKSAKTALNLVGADKASTFSESLKKWMD